MLWANFLHLYQPIRQQEDIFNAVVSQCYKPLFDAINVSKQARLTLNITGSLLDLFDKHKHYYLIDLLRGCLKEGKIELTGSAKYHAFLPLIPNNEIERQIAINNDTCRYYFGNLYKPSGFFPPEMGYAPKMLPIIASFGFKWILLDEIAFDGGSTCPKGDVLYKIKNSNLHVFFRQRRLSNLIMSGIVRSIGSLRKSMTEELYSSDYVVTAMDGETFGHHRIGLNKLFGSLLNSKTPNLVTINDILGLYNTISEITPINSTWSSSTKDIINNSCFISWDDKDNFIHTQQYEFLNLALTLGNKKTGSIKKAARIRHVLDQALASDHFWWASAKPWWSLEMIEDGANALMTVIQKVPGVTKKQLSKASELYLKIISTAFEWQRTGKVRRMAQEQSTIIRIPFRDRTIGAGGAEEGVYYAFTTMLKKLEKKAAKAGEYEKAILWRDAAYKLENKLDIYDAVNAIDLVRQHLPHAHIEKLIEKYKGAYRRIRGGQPEQRGN